MICELVGARHVKLTPAGHEGGIDFFAAIDVPARCHVLSGRQNPMRIIGQTKKHSDKVKIGWLKEFLTTIQEVKDQSPSVERVVPAWFRTSSGPIVGWFIAHNGVQSGLATKAQNHGIIVSDTIDLGEIASLSRRLGSLKPMDRKARNLSDRVNSLISLASVN